jgi:alpha-L-rhamnosidase
MLLEGLPYFERYAAFLEKKIEEGHKFELGDWSGAGSSAEVPVDLIARMYLVKAADVTAFAKKLSGEDASLWEEKAKECRLAVAKLALGEDGRALISAQTLISMLLSFGIGDRAVLAEQLCEVIERDGFMLQAGMVGIQYIYSALFEIGRGDLAFRLLTDSDPGYRTWMNKGATTLWERWAGEDDGSHNHHMFSGVIACFFRYLLGIAPCPDAPAFDRLECKPCLLREVGFAEGELETPKGKILARWQAEEDGFVYTVTLPEGIRATFRGEELRAGENVFRV